MAAYKRIQSPRNPSKGVYTVPYRYAPAQASGDGPPLRSVRSLAYILEWIWNNSNNNRSATRTKRRDDRGSPCLTPLRQLNGFPRIPFKMIDEVLELRILLIQPTHLSQKPLNLRICRIAWCSTLSKAFSKSSFKMTISFLEWWQRWRNWNVQARQSWIVLLFIKPYWLMWISLRMTDWSMMERILVMHFTK